jgi:hypothetical protein
MGGHTAVVSYGKPQAPVEIVVEPVPGPGDTHVQFTVTPLGDAQLVQVQCFITNAEERVEQTVVPLDAAHRTYQVTVHAPFPAHVPQWLVITAQVTVAGHLQARILSLALNEAAVSQPTDPSTLSRDAEGNLLKRREGAVLQQR